MLMHRLGRLERWLLFDDAVFALGFGFSGTSRCDLARLHEFANVSEWGQQARGGKEDGV